MSAELKRVSLVLGKDINLSKINSPSRLGYKRAQVWGCEGQPLIQLAFLSKMDAPIALCIMRANDQKKKPVNVTEMEGMSAAV